MSYLAPFPNVPYYFGEENYSVQFPQLNAYVDILDQIKHQVSFYRTYYIGTNERPDTLSYELYQSPAFYWTFYLLNEKLRQSGWPFPEYRGREIALKKYPNTTLVTTELDTLFTDFLIGQQVRLASGGAFTIIDRNLNLGQITIEGDVTGDNTATTATLLGSGKSLSILSQVTEADAIHHYEDADGNQVDIDPRSGTPVGLNAVTNYTRLTLYNEELREIKVLKDDSVQLIASEFYRKMSA